MFNVLTPQQIEYRGSVVNEAKGVRTQGLPLTKQAFLQS